MPHPKMTSNRFLMKLQENWWIMQIFLIILITALLSAAIGYICRRLSKKFKKSGNHWNRILVNSLNKPSRALLWVLGISYAGDVARVAANNTVLLQIITPFRDVGVIAAIIWFLMRIIHFGENHYIKHRQADVTTVHAMSKLLRISVIITGFLVVLQTLGFSITGVLAFGGIGGLAIGFAAKDLLANFFGGLILYMDRPFKVGDWISSPDRQLEGTVEEISWRLTRIRTFDKRPLYVPNAAFLTIIVINASRMLHRRIRAMISLRYDDWRVIPDIVQEIEEMLRQHEDIEMRQTMFVRLVNFSPSSLDILLYTFTKTTDWVKFQSIQQDVFLKIMDIVAKHGAQCAFPTTTVHVPDGIEMLPAEGDSST